LFQRRGHYGPVRCVAVDPGTGRIYSGSEDMDVKVWRPENSQESDAYPLHRGAATGVAFNPEDDSLVSVGLDGAVWWIDPTGREPPRQLRQEPHPLRQVRFLPGTQTVLVARGGEEPTRNDGTVRFLDARDGRLAGELTTRLAMVSSLSVSLDGRRLVVVGRPREGDTVAQVWDLTSRRLEYAIPAPTAVAAQLYPDGNRLIVLLAQPLDSLNPSFALFDLADGPRPIHSARRFAVAAPYFAVFGTDESFMIMGGQDQCLTLCQINPGGSLTNLSTYRGHAGAIHNGALSPDQRLFATASADETIRVWDRETTRELLALRGDAGPMIDVAFSRTGNFLAAAQGSGTVRVWDGRPRPGPGGQPASPPGR
jgi:WD40 repeat protein